MSAAPTNSDIPQPQPQTAAAPASPAGPAIPLHLVVLLLGVAFLAYVAWQHPTAAAPLTFAAALLAVAVPVMSALFRR